MMRRYDGGNDPYLDYVIALRGFHMDSTQFDTLTRWLGTRRGALGVLASSLATFGLADAGAGKRKNKNVCAGKNTCAKTAFCQSRAECACFVSEGGGKSFCGSASPRNVASCDECASGEACVDLDGPGVPCNIPGLACVGPCLRVK